MNHTLIIVTTLLLTSPSVLNAADDPISQQWDASIPIPTVAELTTIPGVRFSVIKPYEYSKDGYIGYSNNGGNAGRTGKDRELWNNNSAELAVISIEDLRIEP